MGQHWGERGGVPSRGGWLWFWVVVSIGLNLGQALYVLAALFDWVYPRG